MKEGATTAAITTDPGAPFLARSLREKWGFLLTSYKSKGTARTNSVTSVVKGVVTRHAT